MHGALPFLASRKTKPPRRPGTLPKATVLQLVDRVASVLKRGEPTVFAMEATCRHSLRSSLCLAGWRWEIADVTAGRIVSAALAQIGARRPTWQQGQPEHTQDGVIVTERTRCLNCGGRLPEGHVKFCCAACKRSYEWKLADEDERRANAEKVALWRAAFKASAEPRECPECGTVFRPNTPKQIYCCKACANRVNGTRSTWRDVIRSTTSSDVANGAARSFQMTPTGAEPSARRSARMPTTTNLASGPEPKPEPA